MLTLPQSLRFLPAAPLKALGAATAPPGPLARPGLADLYIKVTVPPSITAAQVLSNNVNDAPSSGISFQLARHAKFRQDEYVLGVLHWRPPGSKVPEAEQEEEYAVFEHAWTSETVEQANPPHGPRIMLKKADTHTYGLAIAPGWHCEYAAKKHKPPFDKNRDDWTFSEHAKMVDTVTFPDKVIKRVYLFCYYCSKQGSIVRAKVDYTNVDKIEFE